MNKKIATALTIAALAFAAGAGVVESRGPRFTGLRRTDVAYDAGRRAPSISRHDSRFGGWRGRDDDFHDTYRRNAGRIESEAPKRVTNIRAKISAREIADDNREIRREKARKSPISTYSNYDFLFKDKNEASGSTTMIVQKQINISNSIVTLN